jgi:hypothetical protein
MTKEVKKSPQGFGKDPSTEPLWVVFARKFWRPVHRKRKSVRSTNFAKDSAGNPIWIVEDREMTEQELRSRVSDLAISNIRPLWGIVTDEEVRSLSHFSIQEID